MQSVRGPLGLTPPLCPGSVTASCTVGAFLSPQAQRQDVLLRKPPPPGRWGQAPARPPTAPRGAREQGASWESLVGRCLGEARGRKTGRQGT